MVLSFYTANLEELTLDSVLESLDSYFLEGLSIYNFEILRARSSLEDYFGSIGRLKGIMVPRLLQEIDFKTILFARWINLSSRS